MTQPDDFVDPAHEARIAALKKSTAAHEEYTRLREATGLPNYVPAVVRSEDDPLYVAMMRAKEADEELEAVFKRYPY